MTKNFEKVFKVFKNHYKIIPLEHFKNDPLKTLVSTLLSSRTKDEVTFEASKRLFKKASNLKQLGKLETIEIQKLIYPVGFYKTKAKHLKSLERMISNNFNGKVPSSREELMKLPGVGRKTANLVLNRAYNIPAIAVDTHVHKISNLLGWVKTKTPEQTEKELDRILPKKYWSDMNRLFVSMGRQFTSKRKLVKFLEDNKLISPKR